MNKKSNLLKNMPIYKRAADICIEFGVSNTTIWRWVESGRLPRPLKINGHRYWDSSVKPLTDEEYSRKPCENRIRAEVTHGEES